MDTQGSSKEEEPYGIFRCCACHEYKAMDDIRIIPRAEPFLSMFMTDLSVGFNFIQWVRENVKTLHRNEQLAVCTDHIRPGNAKEKMKIRATSSNYAVRCPNFKGLTKSMPPAPVHRPQTSRPLLPVKMMPKTAALYAKRGKLPGLYERKLPLRPKKGVPRRNTSPVYVNIEPTPFYTPQKITELTIPTSVFDNRLTHIVSRLREELNDMGKQSLFEAVIAMVYDKSGLTTEEIANEFQVSITHLSSVALEVIAFFEKEKPGAKVDQREYAPPALYVPLKTKEDWADLYNFCYKNINEKSFVFKLGLYEKIRIANGCVESILCGTQPQVAHKKYLIQYDRGVFTQFITQLTSSKSLQPGFLQCVTSRGYLFAPNKGIVKEAKVIVDYNADQDVKYEDDTIRLLTFDVALQAIRNFGTGINSSDHILDLVDFSGTEDELSKEMDELLYNFGVHRLTRMNIIKACLDYYQDSTRSLEEVCASVSLEWNLFWFFLRVLRTFLNLDTFYRDDEDMRLTGQIFKCRHPFRLCKNLLFQLGDFDHLDSFLIGTQPPAGWESSIVAATDEYLQFNENEKANEYLMDGNQHYQISDSLCPVDLYSEVPMYNAPSSSGLNSGMYHGEHVRYVYDHDPAQEYNNVNNLL